MEQQININLALRVWQHRILRHRQSTTKGYRTPVIALAETSPGNIVPKDLN
jgi:hypothetical protein